MIFPTATFELTEEQRQKLAPLFEASMDAGMKAHAWAILMQPKLQADGAIIVDCVVVRQPFARIVQTTVVEDRRERGEIL